jgi:hypothetical protein
MAGFFLATPGDLAGLHENAVRLFYLMAPGGKKPAIVNVARSHF